MLNINTNKTYFSLLLLALISISIFEIHYVLYFITILFYYSKVSKKIIELIFFFIAIIIVAGISSIFNDNLLYNWLKDLAYFSRPILAILAGYLISKRIKDFIDIARIIVFVASLFAVIHVFKVFFLIDFNVASVSDIRKVGGISNEIEVFAIVILIASAKIKGMNIISNKLLKKVVLILFAISFMLYLSRAMIVTFTFFLLASLGYLKITRKSIKYGILVITMFGLFYAYLFSREFERGKPGIESFLYKMKIAPAEIFSPAKSMKAKKHADLWDHWRAYEAYMAISQMNTSTSLFIGKGFGSLIDLKFPAPLGEKKMRYIPTLHNGYVTIFYKSGLIGLLFYLFFLITLYLFCYTKEKSPSSKFMFNLVAGLALHYMFSSLIVTGIYNNMEPYAFILGVLLYFSVGNKNKLIEE